jgi:hypothetical protein
VGTFGKIGFIEQSSGEIQARARFRDYDGRTRLVAKTGPSRAAAERALKKELSSRQFPAGTGAIAAAMRLALLADTWLDAPHGWSTGTKRTYRSVVRNQVKPALGQLCVREVTRPVLSAGHWLPSHGVAERARRSRLGPACRECSGSRSRMARSPRIRCGTRLRGSVSARSHLEH